jgi:hypothetical protein
MSPTRARRIVTRSATQAAAAPDNPPGYEERRSSHDATTASSRQRVQELHPQMSRSDLATLSTTVSSPLQSTESEDPEMGHSSPPTVRRARARREDDDVSSDGSRRSRRSATNDVPVIKRERISGDESGRAAHDARTTHPSSSRAQGHESERHRHSRHSRTSEREMSDGEHERRRKDKRPKKSRRSSVEPRARRHSRREHANVDTDERNVDRYLDRLIHSVVEQIQNNDNVLPVLDGMEPPRNRELLNLAALGGRINTGLRTLTRTDDARRDHR